MVNKVEGLQDTSPERVDRPTEPIAVVIQVIGEWQGDHTLTAEDHLFGYISDKKDNLYGVDASYYPDQDQDYLRLFCGIDTPANLSARRLNLLTRLFREINDGLPFGHFIVDSRGIGFAYTILILKTPKWWPLMEHIDMVFKHGVGYLTNYSPLIQEVLGKGRYPDANIIDLLMSSPLGEA